MANFISPGQTFKLSPAWPTNGDWEGDPNQWRIYWKSFAGSLASTAKPRGWTVTLISGSFGAADCVVDITPPGNLNWEQGSFKSCHSFEHGREDGQGAETPRYIQYFHIHHNALVYPNRPYCALAATRGGQLTSAVLEQDGLHFYSITGAIADKKERGAVIDAEAPSLFYDSAGVLYCVADARADPCNDNGHLWRCYRSRDNGKTFDAGATLPFPGNVAVARAAILANGLIVAIARAGSQYYYLQSGDGGQSWSQSATARLISPLAMTAFLEAPTGDVLMWGGGTALANIIVASHDNFRTGYDYGPPPPPKPVGSPGASHDTRGGFLLGINGLLMVTSSNSEDIWATYSYDGGQTWRSSLIGAMGPYGWAMLTENLNGSIIATNGRDWQYQSLDGGRTWTAL